MEIPTFHVLWGYDANFKSGLGVQKKGNVD